MNILTKLTILLIFTNPLTIGWIIAILMNLYDLNASSEVWYGGILFLTNAVIIGISTALTILIIITMYEKIKSNNET